MLEQWTKLEFVFPFWKCAAKPKSCCYIKWKSAFYIRNLIIFWLYRMGWHVQSDAIVRLLLLWIILFSMLELFVCLNVLCLAFSSFSWAKWIVDFLQLKIWIFSAWRRVDFEFNSRKPEQWPSFTAFVIPQKAKSDIQNELHRAMKSNNCFNKCKKFTSTTLNVIVHMPYFNRAKIYLESISLRVMKLFSHRKTNGNVGCMYGPNLWCGVEWQNWLN